MASLIYGTNASLDGFINDTDANFDWSVPDEPLHDYFADLVSRCGTFLYGRRLHQTMAIWQEWAGRDDLDPPMRRFADAWADADKVIYSRTLDDAGIDRARIVREFVAEEVRALVDAAERDVLIGGAELAGAAFQAGLIDEVVLAVHPILIGGGTPAFPADLRRELRLVESREFPGGAVVLRYVPR